MKIEKEGRGTVGCTTVGASLSCESESWRPRAASSSMGGERGVFTFSPCDDLPRSNGPTAE